MYAVDSRVRTKVLVSDVPIVREFADMFPEVLPSVPPERQVEFRTDSVLDC